MDHKERKPVSFNLSIFRQQLYVSSILQQQYVTTIENNTVIQNVEKSGLFCVLYFFRLTIRTEITIQYNRPYASNFTIIKVTLQRLLFNGFAIMVLITTQMPYT